MYEFMMFLIAVVTTAFAVFIVGLVVFVLWGMINLWRDHR